MNTVSNEEVILTPIPSYRGFSDYLVNSETGQIWNKRLNRYLQLNPNSNGYVYATLIDDNGEPAGYGVHRVVASSVYGEPIELFKRGGYEVDHYPDEEETWNNSRHNLKITDRKGQYRDSTRAKMGKGKRLKESDVCEILEQLEEWKENENNKISTFIHMTAEAYGQGYRNVWNIVNGKSWSHLHSEG
jgi:hypothetical protein